jgi:hypothetical protein
VRVCFVVERKSVIRENWLKQIIDTIIGLPSIFFWYRYSNNRNDIKQKNQYR